MLDELLLAESHGLQRVAHYEYLLMLIMQHQRPQVKDAQVDRGGLNPMRYRNSACAEGQESLGDDLVGEGVRPYLATNASGCVL